MIVKFTYILSKVSHYYMILKDYIPWTKTAVQDAMSVFEKAKANLEKVKAHQIKVAGAAKQATVDAEGALLKAQEARTGAEEEIKEAVATKKAIDSFLK